MIENLRVKCQQAGRELGAIGQDCGLEGTENMLVKF